MRISDWSSDVCSSDLRDGIKAATNGSAPAAHLLSAIPAIIRKAFGSAARVGTSTQSKYGTSASSPIWITSVSLARATSRSHCAAYAASHARSEEHTSELQSLMRISYAVFCLNKKYKIQIEYLNDKYEMR